MNEVFEELQAALHSAWHRRWLVLGVAWGVCLLGWLAVAMIPNTYESKARVFVQLDDVLSEQIGIANAGQDEIERVRKTLASSVNLEKVVRSTRLGADVTSPAQMERTVAGLAEKVKVVSTEDNLFEITAQIGESSLSDAQNAALAQDVVQKMIDIFREENIAGSRGEVADTIVFLDQQLEDRKRELEAAEQRRLAFEAEHPELIGGTATLSTRLQQLRAEMRGVDADLAAAQSALAAVNGQIAGTPRTIVTAGEGGGARGALIQARSQLAALQARGLTANHPDVAALQRQIDLLERQAANEGPGAGGTVNPAYSSLVAIRAERDANVQALMARKAALQADLSAMMASQADEPAVAAEANRISRDYEVLKRKYDELLQDREEMRLRGQVESERSSFSFEVIDPPSTPRAPAAPNRPILLIGVLIVGVGAGVGAAFAFSQIRSTFATGAKLERSLGLPVIGTISHTLTDAGRALARKRMRMFAAGCASLAGVCVLLLVVEFVQRGMVG
ncbi:XrtA system polysaccharide chain length determinant [Pelagerythrobacter marinus]|uniref:Chain-length determining protein n=1 Tax=Pelagerythrobacter marinus TaxID=538382 RepID=A0ABW9URZ2_9SPHN|nr:XrtA system polysaccharide chain length determinant [Pelagerythrobacter marinus]MXO67644.1 chain-length determining protein [Pelagerythrobacter marinus]USA38330.1 chain-length determining protein [Pelagerythrobacter marinus]WPZ07708.1 XrtA system polysaccharide chain length determinant [Pelagerythrobacter marinus]